jgi:TRAP-type C4-dicarboxylate transport system permease small subunit
MAGVDLPQGVDYLPLVGGGALICLFSFERLLTDLTGGRVPEVPLAHVHTVE